jgi:hypothetical protein
LSHNVSGGSDHVTHSYADFSWSCSTCTQGHWQNAGVWSCSTITQNQWWVAGVWLHGEAVAAGMVMAADMSHRLGWIDQSILDRTRHLLQRAKLPVEVPQVRAFLHLAAYAPLTILHALGMVCLADVECLAPLP